MRLSRLAALCLLVLPSAGAWADDIGPAQAQTLQRQLQDWLAGLLGPAAKPPGTGWQISGAHDHYVLTWPIQGLSTPMGPAAATADLRPLDGGRWAVDDMKLPQAGTFTMTLPDVGEGGKGNQVQARFSIGRQDTHGVIDPGLATPSTLHTDMGDLVVASDNAQQRQEQRIDRYLAEASLTPGQDGHLDGRMDASVTGWKSASQMNSGAPVAIGIQTMHAIGQANGINRDRAAELLAATSGLIGALPPDFATKEDKLDLPAPAMAQLRLLIACLQDLMTGVRLEETVDGLQVEIAGMGGGSIRHFLFGFGGEAPDGRLHAWIDIAVDELASPSLPPKIAAYLPHHIAIRPSLSGVPTADLRKLALDATEAGADSQSLGPDVAAIFAHGGADLGVETLAFDVGPARLNGTGRMTVTGPDTWRGEAHFVATGFDDLTTQARDNPDLQQALPALIMLRGLAKQDGERLVWNVISDGPSLTVNGMDLSQIAGGGKPKGKRAQPSR